MIVGRREGSVTEHGRESARERAKTVLGETELWGRENEFEEEVEIGRNRERER